MYTVDVLGGERERQRSDLLIIFMPVCRQFDLRVVSVWRRTLQDAGTVILQRASRWPAGPEGFSSKANGEWVSAAEDWMNLFLNSELSFLIFSLFLLLQTTVPWAWEALGGFMTMVILGSIYDHPVFRGSHDIYTYIHSIAVSIHSIVYSTIYCRHRTEHKISPRTQPSSTEGWPDRTSLPWTMRARLEPNACCGV